MPSPSSKLPLMRFCGSSEFYMHPACGVIGFPASASSSLFPSGKAVFTKTPSAVAFAAGSSSHELTVSSEFASSHLPRLSAWDSFLGVLFPLRDMKKKHRRRASQPTASSVLDVSHVFDGLIRFFPRGFVSPHYHAKGFPSGSNSLRTAGNVLRHPVPSCRLCRIPADGEPSAPVFGTSPSGLFSVRKVVTGRRFLIGLPARHPHGFYLLQVLPPNRVGVPSHALASMVFEKRCHCRLFSDLRRFNHDRLGLSLSRLPTC